jgi:hypothetical protein
MKKVHATPALQRGTCNNNFKEKKKKQLRDPLRTTDLSVVREKKKKNKKLSVLGLNITIFSLLAFALIFNFASKRKSGLLHI